MNTIQQLSKFATFIGVELQHPTSIADLLSRRVAAAQLKGTRRESIADILADLDPSKWTKAIKDQAVARVEAETRETAFRTLPAILDKQVEKAAREHLDTYLAQLHGPLKSAETAFVDAAQHLTPMQLDPAVAVANRVGDHLSEFDQAFTVLDGYASMLDQIVPRHLDGTATVAAGALTTPPAVPVERRTEVSMMQTQHTLTAPEDMARIIAARELRNALASHRERRHTLHHIANDNADQISVALTVGQYRGQSARWAALSRVETVASNNIDKYSLTSLTTI